MRALGQVFKRQPENFKREMRGAIETTVESVANAARRNASGHKRTGLLVEFIEGKVIKASGIGIVGVRKGYEARAGRGGSGLLSKGAKVIRPSRYAHFLEFGSKRQRAYPFMIPAAESNRQLMAREVTAAAKRATEQQPEKIEMTIGGNTGLL